MKKEKTVEVLDGVGIQRVNVAVPITLSASAWWQSCECCDEDG